MILEINNIAHAGFSLTCLQLTYTKNNEMPCIGLRMSLDLRDVRKIHDVLR